MVRGPAGAGEVLPLQIRRGVGFFLAILKWRGWAGGGPQKVVLTLGLDVLAILKGGTTSTARN